MQEILSRCGEILSVFEDRIFRVLVLGMSLQRPLKGT